MAFAALSPPHGDLSPLLPAPTPAPLLPLSPTTGQAREDEENKTKRYAPEILAAHFSSDASQAIRGGRYFIYRPPQDSVVSHHRAAARRPTPPAPPRPPSLHLELPKLKANVLLPQRSPSCKASGVSHHKRPCRARRPWRQTFATNGRLRRSGGRRSEWSLTAARVVTCPTPVHGSALGVDFLELSRLASPDHRICRGERRAGELKEEERRLRCLY